MFLYPDPLVGRAFLQAKVKMLADEHAKALKLPILIDQAILFEAHDAARGTALFHQIPLGQISHFKELAHVGFWISHLKPISIQEPVSPSQIMRWLGIAAQGNSAELAPAYKRYTAAARAYKKEATFPISEYVALELVAHFVEAEF